MIAGVTLLVLTGRAAAEPAELSGASPGERAAITAYCGGSRGAIARGMCMSNQITSILRLGRKPDLSVAGPARREAIETACRGDSVPASRFACERQQLRAAGLPVRDEPGGGSLFAAAGGGAGMFSSKASAGLPRFGEQPEFPYFDLEQWRSERPPMPAARDGASLSTQALYQKVAPSIYVVVATDHAVELAERAPHAQGSAVAITDRILLTNCHIVAGRPQIRVSQRGQSGRAALIYADPGGDRCFLKSESMELHPIDGVRRFEDLRVGEPVYSIGTPSGLEQSFGSGAISGLRQLEGVKVIQNSAPISFGSSGGGLFDARGNLVGITTATDTRMANVNFSIAAADFWF